MTAATVTPEVVAITPAELRRARIVGFAYIAMAILVLWLFALGTEGDARFGLAQPTERFKDFPDLVLPAAPFAYAVAVVLAFLGGAQLMRGFGKWTNIILGIALLLFVFAFLTWATAGKSFSLVGMLRETVLRATPIGLGALSGVLCERVAVINIAIEGMLLTGAFTGAIVGSAARNVEIGGLNIAVYLGIGLAIFSGALLALALGVLAIKYRVDQIIVGVVINIFAVGLTGFMSVRVLANNAHLNSTSTARPIGIPLLEDIPVLGTVFFRQNIFVYVMFILTALLTFGLFRTRWGLRSRAVGEHPRAADTLGVRVYRLRYLNVMLGGMVAGFGGAYLTLGAVGRFDDNMTSGRGFIALAAMIFGRWHPVGAVSGALVFGFAEAIRTKLAILGTNIPSEFLAMTPYVVTIIVVAGLVGKARPPAADGQPYVKEGG